MRYERIGTHWTLQIMDNGSVSLIDTVHQVRWGGKVPGWVTVENESGQKERLAIGAPAQVNRTENGVKVTYNTQAFSFVATFALDNAELEISLQQQSCRGTLVSLEYPAHMLRVDSGEKDGYVVIPHKQGTLIPARLDAGFMRHRHNSWRNISDINQTIPFESCGLNMTWFGAHLNGSSVICNIEEAADCSLHIVGNAVMDDEGNAVDSHQGVLPGERYSSLTPVWQASHGQLSYTRTIRISQVENGYVGMCKLYRDLKKSSGRYVTLKDKMKQNPLVGGMIGAPDIKIYIYTNRRQETRLRSWSEPILDGYECVHTTFEQVSEIVDDMKSMNMEHALILLGGWNRAGYDREHIDMWPPAQKAGGAEGLRRASEHATQAGYIFSLHDNYQDFYPDSPSYDEKYLMKHADGSVKLGGIWDGGLCRLVCSSQAIQLAKPVVNAVRNCTKVNSYYLDTTTSAPVYECYDHEHPMTRKEDRENKIALLEMLAEQGWVVGGEAGSDWAVPVCSFFEGMPGTAIGLNGGVESAGFGMMVPLFNLVYHETVVCYWQHGQPFGREDHINHVLHDLLSAQPSNWSLVYDQWEDLKPLIKQCYDLLGTLHASCAHAEMINHEFLTPDFEVHRTQFSNGTEVVVNFDIRSYTYESYRIPPKGFLVKRNGEPVKIGSMSRDVVYQQ